MGKDQGREFYTETEAAISGGGILSKAVIARVKNRGWCRDNCRVPSKGVGFTGSSDGKESTCNARDLGSIPGSGRSPGERHGNPLQYSCLENSMDRGARWATDTQGVAPWVLALAWAA